MNSVHLIGRIANEPELKYTQKQKAFVSLRLAVDAGYVDQSGQRQTYFFDVVAWEGTAQFVAQWFAKGQMIALSGKLQTRSWTDKFEQKRVNVEIVAQSVYFCGDRKTEAHGSSYTTPASCGRPSSTADAVPLPQRGRHMEMDYGGETGEQTRFDYRNDFRPLEDDDDVPF